VIDRNDEQMGRILAYLMAQKPRNGRAGCPDEETLASYLADVLTPSMGEEVETHLAQCAACLDDLSAAYSSMRGDEKETVPEALIAKAMALIPQAAQEGFFDMVVRLARGSLELVSTTGQLVEVPGLAGIRGKLESPGTTILQVEKEMGRFKVAVEVEPLEDELCQLAVTVRGRGALPADSIRLSLLAGGREQASYLARQGTAIFDRIPPGDYRLAISEANAALGSIRLTIKEGHHGL
jgi:Putative zinc-finger